MRLHPVCVLTALLSAAATLAPLSAQTSPCVGSLTPLCGLGDAPGIGQGTATAISDDGNTVAIGIRTNASQGAAWVFVRNPVSGLWSQDGGVIRPAVIDATVGNYGSALALSGDGSTLLMGVQAITGATDALAGTVVFERVNNAWVERTPRLTKSDSRLPLSPFDTLGLSRTGSTAVIGQATTVAGTNGKVVVHERTGGVGGTWSAGTTLVPSTGAGAGEQRFGSAVAISADGNTIAVATMPTGVTNSGAVDVYQRIAAAWILLGQRIVSPNGASAADNFGSSIDLSDDGQTLVASIPSGNTPGMAVFKLVGGAWLQQGSVMPSFIPGGSTAFGARSVAISGDGRLVAAGSQGGGLGCVNLFSQSGNTWSRFNPSELAAQVSWPSPVTYAACIDLSASGSLAIGYPGAAVTSTGSGAVNIAPISMGFSIAPQPSPTTVDNQGHASLTIGVSSLTGVSRQWRRNGVPLVDGALPGGTIVSGTTSATLSFSNVQAADVSGQGFDCLVTSGCSSLASATASVSIGSHCRADVGVQGGIPGSDGVLDNNDFIVFIDDFFNHTGCQ